MQKNSYRVLVIGAGTGGISVAARLRKKMAADEIAVIDAAETHFYQPLWSIVGAGILAKERTAKPQAQVIPNGVAWVRDAVEKVDPDRKTVVLKSQREIGYEFLVVASGLRLAWEKIAGLEGNLGKNGLCTIYEYDQVSKAAEMIQKFQGGHAIFVMPPVPIKCAGAPQKIMYLADDIFRQHGVREKSKIQFATAGKAMFGVPVFSKALDEVVKRKSIETLFQHRLLSVDAAKKITLFEVTDASGAVVKKELPYDLLHVVPPMSAHAYVADSGLAVAEGDQKGWLAVDKFTLRHLVHPEIFGIGDVTGVPNSKTAAAIRKQTPVVAGNLLQVMAGKVPSHRYDGYSSCPLITGVGKVILAEFGYDGKLMPTFPFDATQERRSMWHLKKDMLPHLYWRGMLKGRA